MYNPSFIDEAFSASSSSAFTKDTPVGTTVSGAITDVDYRQAKDFDSGEPAVWASGEPKFEFVITIQAFPETDTDPGKRSIYINHWGNTRTWLEAAIKATGVSKASEALHPGSIFTATLVERNRSFSNAKSGKSYTQNVFAYAIDVRNHIDQALTPAQPVQQGYVQQPAAQPPQQVPAAQQAPQPAQTPIQQTPQPAAPAIDPAVVAKVLPLLQFGTPLDTLTRATGVDEATVRQVAAAHGLQVA